MYSTSYILHVILPRCFSVHLCLCFPPFLLNFTSPYLEPMTTAEWHCKQVVLLILKSLQPIFVGHDLRFLKWKIKKKSCQYWNRFNLYGRSQYVFREAWICTAQKYTVTSRNIITLCSEKFDLPNSILPTWRYWFL